MASSRLLLILSFIFPLLLDHLVPPTIAQVVYQDDDAHRTSSQFTANYENGNIYQRNLNTLLSSFSSNLSSFGFYSSSFGADPDKVNAVTLCRGDLSLEECRTCVSDSSEIIMKNCSKKKEAIFWSGVCMLRYSQRLILGVEENDPVRYVTNPNNVTRVEAFNLVLNPIFVNLTKRAATSDLPGQKFAAGHASVDGGNETIYALVQCSPDLDEGNCSSCLRRSIDDVSKCCGGRQGGRVLRPSCNLWFEVFRFYDGTVDTLVDVSSMVTTSEAPTSSENPSILVRGKESGMKRIIIIVVAVAFVIMLLRGIGIILRVKQKRVNYGKKTTHDQYHDFSQEISFVESLQYDFETVRAATNDFSDENKLGQGGFGVVYKGMLSNGNYIAVKRLSKSSEQGDREFKNEVTLLAQLQHRNLVRLLGFCLQGVERLLIYEYIPNTSLNHFIFDPTNHGLLDWETRYKIIGGLVRGLVYLHEDSRLRIIRRDLKPSNILLDENMNPKIADFGMARLFVMDQTRGDTKVVVGTYGYLAPEYALHGRFSVRSDVFSFGVILIEIITGKKNNNFRNGENEEDLLSYVWKHWREDAVPNIIDPMLTTGSRNEMIRCIHIGLLCVQENVNDRPNMAAIVTMLSSHSLTISVPSKPAYYCHYNSKSYTRNTGTSESSFYVSDNEVSNIAEPYPR